MGKSKPPSPADTAAAQGALNTESIREMARVNRPNMNTPYGSMRWTTDANGNWEGTQNDDPRIVDNYFRGLGAANNALDLSSFMTDATRGFIRNNDGSYRVFDPKDIPSAVDRVDSNQVIGQVDLSGLQDLPGINDFGGERKRVEDALYSRQSERLDPQFNDRRQALETKLMQQGFTQGSEGWTKAVQDFEREREQAYAGARNDAITGGGTEQSRLFADALAGRGQGVGERFDSANFYNNAGQQDFAQRFQSGQFQNAIRNQRFGEELAKRNQVFNEFSQLLYGAAPQTPNVANPTQIQGVGSPDFISAQNSANAAGAARNAGKTGGAATIASAAIAAF